jgi:hypothetical protein
MITPFIKPRILKEYQEDKALRLIVLKLREIKVVLNSMKGDEVRWFDPNDNSLEGRDLALV